MVMVMDGSQIIGNLESLWYFSNVFSSSSTTTQEQMGRVTLELSDQEEEEEDEEEKPTNQGEESQQNDGCAENLVKSCKICGEFAAEIESLKVVVEQVGQAVEELVNKTEDKKKGSSSSSSNSSSRSRRRRRRITRRREILGEADLGFHESPWLLDDGQEEPTFEKMKMPPLNDGTAMKQHLKSWAYAVACTVR